MCWKAMGLTTVGVVFGVAAFICGETIGNAADTQQMFLLTMLAIALFGVCALLVGAGAVVDEQEAKSRDKKIKRVPTHNNGWRGDCE